MVKDLLVDIDILIPHANEREIQILQQIKDLCFLTLSSEHQYLRFDGD